MISPDRTTEPAVHTLTTRGLGFRMRCDPVPSSLALFRVLLFRPAQWTTLALGVWPAWPSRRFQLGNPKCKSPTCPRGQRRGHPRTLFRPEMPWPGTGPTFSGGPSRQERVHSAAAAGWRGLGRGREAKSSGEQWGSLGCGPPTLSCPPPHLPISRFSALEDPFFF